MNMREALEGLKDPLHLGDGLYIGHDDYGVWLKAERDGRMHEVYVEPGVWQNLVLYWQRMHARPTEVQHEDPGYADGNDND